MAWAALVVVGSELERVAQIPAVDDSNKLTRDVFAVDPPCPNMPRDFFWARAAIRPLGSEVDGPHLCSIDVSLS